MDVSRYTSRVGLPEGASFPQPRWPLAPSALHPRIPLVSGPLGGRPRHLCRSKGPQVQAWEAQAGLVQRGSPGQQQGPAQCLQKGQGPGQEWGRLEGRAQGGQRGRPGTGTLCH